MTAAPPPDVQHDLPPSVITAAVDAPRFELARNIARKRGWLATPKRRLTAALIVSLLIHLIAGSVVRMELTGPPDKPIAVTIERLAPPPAIDAAPQPAVQPAPKPRPKPRPKAPEAVIAAATPAVPDPVLTEPEPTLFPEPVASSPALAQVLPELAPEPVVESVPEVSPEPRSAMAVGSQPNAPPATPEPPTQLPPRRIELSYTAFLGEQKFEVGPVNLVFTRDDNNRYQLKLTGRGRGLAALLYPGTFTGESEGTISATGLRPDRFTEERGNPDKRKEVRFDHIKQQVLLPEKEPITYEGAPHDPLTWIVQFYFAAPKGGEVTFSVANTRKIDVYTLRKTAEETLDTPVGRVDTQIWSGERKKEPDGTGGGSAQFWLAPEWHYVPFKLKVVNAQGRSASFELTGAKQIP